MPLLLNVNVSRKVGEPNYGSRGASVSLQQELDGALVHKPDELAAQIKSLFHQARAAVEAELVRPAADSGDATNRSFTNGNGQHPQGDGRRATPGQIRALHAIANRLQIDLSSLLDRQFQPGTLEDLSRQQASQLIDELNGEPMQNEGRL